MPAFGPGDQVADQGKSSNLPNFVGQLFKLSPLEAPTVTLAGGMSGGIPANAPEFTWQDTLHRAPAQPNFAEGADATYSSQKRVERRNVTAIFQYGVELSYRKQAAVGQLGTTGDSPTITAKSILGTQPVQNERSFQMQIKIEQAKLDSEIMFLEGTLAAPNTGAAWQSQGILGVIPAETTTDYTAAAGTKGSKAVVEDLMIKLFNEGAPRRQLVLQANSQTMNEIANDYQKDGNIQPRSYTTFGVNILEIMTNFGRLGLVLNRHLDANTILINEVPLLKPRMLATPGKGHFFVEPLAKAGSYDREQLYGDWGLEYGPAGWHAKAINLHAGP